LLVIATTPVMTHVRPAITWNVSRTAKAIETSSPTTGLRSAGKSGTYGPHPAYGSVVTVTSGGRLVTWDR